MQSAVFVSREGGGLNRAHATWLENALIQRASQVDQSHLENSNEGQPPQLSEAERADTQAFLREILQILPLIGLTCFEMPKAVAKPEAKSSPPATESTDELDTVVVPAQQEGFERVFLGKNVWHAIRISGGMLPKIKYIAAYQSPPVSAITHLAPVARIEPYGDKGKYQTALPPRPPPVGHFAPDGRHKRAAARSPNVS